MEADPGAADRLIEAVNGSAKYRLVDPAMIRALGSRELARGSSADAAVKMTKRRLHQVCGAFRTGPPHYHRWRDRLETARAAADAESLAEVCRSVMAEHASTRERLPELVSFYRETIGALPPPRSVIDLGCGLHPLALPWMGLPADTSYSCYDLDSGIVELARGFLDAAGAAGEGAVGDVLAAPPEAPADLAFVLKLLPILDHLEPGGGGRLLKALRARWILASFSTRSLGGRRLISRGHEAGLVALAETEGWAIRRIPFPSEVAFLIDKGL